MSLFSFLTKKKNYIFGKTNKVYLSQLVKSKTFIDGSIADNFYSTVQKEWISEVFASKYSSFVSSMKSKYSRANFECDDWARECAYFASIYQNGLAFGEFWFYKDSGERHAVNFFITNENELMFFEPQEFRLINLTENEMRSCLGWRI